MTNESPLVPKNMVKWKLRVSTVDVHLSELSNTMGAGNEIRRNSLLKE